MAEIIRRECTHREGKKQAQRWRRKGEEQGEGAVGEEGEDSGLVVLLSGKQPGRQARSY